MALVNVLECSRERVLPVIAWGDRVDGETNRKIEFPVEFSFVSTGKTNLLTKCLSIDREFWIFIQNLNGSSKEVALRVTKEIFERIVVCLGFLCIPVSITEINQFRNIIEIVPDRTISANTLIAYDKYIP